MDNKTKLLIPKYDISVSINNNKNIIQAALEIGIKLAFSCRSGVCGTCKAKIIKGKIDNSSRVTHNLTPEERNNNIIYTCQSLPKSKTLELEFLSPLSNKIYSLSEPKEYVLEILGIKSMNNIYSELITSFPKKLYIFHHDGMKVELLSNGEKSNKKYNILSPKLLEDGTNNGLLTIYIPKSDINFIKDLKIGQIITILGPFNKKDEVKYNNNPLFFLSSKYEVIKILSKIKECLFNNNELAILLVVYFDRVKDIEYMYEMHRLKNIYKNFNYKIILTKEDNKNTRFFYGAIQDVLGKIISNLSNHIIHIGNIDSYDTKIIDKLNELDGNVKNIITID